MHFFQDSAESDAMRLGSAIHLALLQPDEYVKQVKEQPEFNLRTKDGKAEKAKFLALNHDKIILDSDEAEIVRGIVESVGSIKTASSILKSGDVEVSAFAEIDGFHVKARMDILHKTCPIIFDIKTTSDCSAREFTKSIVDYGYDVQGALYCDVMEKITGQPHGFGILAVEKKPPYTFSVYQLDDVFIEYGRRGYRSLIEKYKETVLKGKLIDTLAAPDWIQYRR